MGIPLNALAHAVAAYILAGETDATLNVAEASSDMGSGPLWVPVDLAGPLDALVWRGSLQHDEVGWST